jgi:TrmH family RNA methyltransferase
MENWKNTAKLIRSLKDKKVRDEMGLFVVEGEKMVLEALGSDFQVESVFISKEDCLARIRQASEKGNPDCGVEMISTAMMEKISLLSSPSYCLALVRKKTERFDLKGFCKKGVLALALDGVRDPGNI